MPIYDFPTYYLWSIDVTTCYNNQSLADPRLDPVWAALDVRGAVVHIHPTTTIAPAGVGLLAAPVIEVAFETARTVADMLYARIFLRFPRIKFVLAHAGGALPALAGRLELLGAESWADNQQGVTREEITRQLGGLHVDTAASARTGISAAAVMCGPEKCVYESDCGVPCSTEETMRMNQADLAAIERRLGLKENSFGRHGWKLFPNASERAGIAWATE